MTPQPGSTQALGSVQADTPKTIGGYQVEAKIGEGGMGRVYACRDETLDRRVAIKVLLAEVAREPAMTERFLREARAMATLTSPRVVTVYHVGSDGDLPYLVMEYLEGEDLSRTVKRQGALAVADVLTYALHTVEGLRVATRAGLVHRDIKPSNLFLTPGGVKLTDFGLARPLDGSADLTQAGLVVGSPHYLAPELARGLPATAQSDMYALGASLCELLTGTPPFSGQAPVDVVTQHLTQPVPDLRTRRPELPGAIAAVVQRMLAKIPKDRFADYDELEAALRESSDAVEAGEGPTLPPAGPRALAAETVAARLTEGSRTARPTPRWRGIVDLLGRRRGMVLTAGAALVLVLIWSMLGDDRLKRIDAGQARAVLEEIQTLPATQRSGQDELVRGHALVALRRVDEAMRAYQKALKGGASDDRARRHIFEAIEDDEAPEAAEVLALWPDSDIDKVLRSLVLEGEWWPRHNAMRALEGRRDVEPELQEQLGRLDLKSGDSCPRRRMGLMRLKRMGQSRAAADAIRSASQRMPDNLCMLLDFPGAEQAVRARLGDTEE
ncbi:MAG: serine/threonine-protein kinase [Pseudomonadota bacterium]